MCLQSAQQCDKIPKTTVRRPCRGDAGTEARGVVRVRDEGSAWPRLNSQGVRQVLSGHRSAEGSGVGLTICRMILFEGAVVQSGSIVRGRGRGATAVVRSRSGRMKPHESLLISKTKSISRNTDQIRSRAAVGFCRLTRQRGVAYIDAERNRSDLWISCCRVARGFFQELRLCRKRLDQRDRLSVDEKLKNLSPDRPVRARPQGRPGILSSDHQTTPAPVRCTLTEQLSKGPAQGGLP